MLPFASSGILLRRTEYGDYDLIPTFITLSHGKLTLMAKYARKSRKRFSGTLELFSEIGFIGAYPRKGGMPILQEAWIKQPFAGIRGDLLKTAYAAYWCELVLSWLEEGKAQPKIYHLLRYALASLEPPAGAAENGISPGVASIVFQLYFLLASGLSPDFEKCSRCGLELDRMPGETCGFDLEKGGLVCQRCISERSLPYPLSKGTVKQLRWVQAGPLQKVGRIKFSTRAINESLTFLEAFVPYHLGREPKSRKFLTHVRKLKA